MTLPKLLLLAGFLGVWAFIACNEFNPAGEHTPNPSTLHHIERSEAITLYRVERELRQYAELCREELSLQRDFDQQPVVHPDDPHLELLMQCIHTVALIANRDRR